MRHDHPEGIRAGIRPLSIPEMTSTPYDITTFQPTLFGAESLGQVLDVVGTYFQSVAAEAAHAPRRNHVSPQEG